MLRKIFESTLIMGTSSILVMAINLVRVKILAVLLGPMGVGALSVLNHFHSLAGIFLGLGLGTGIAKYVASSNSVKRYEFQNKIFSNSCQILLVISIIGLIVVCALNKFLSKQMFGDENYGVFIIIFSISFPLAVYPNIASSILQGLKRIKALALINVLRSTISLLIIIPMVYFFRLKGAIFSVIVVTVIHLILIHYFISKEDRKFGINNWFVFDRDVIKKLFKYGLTSLLVGTAYYLSHLILKILIVDSLGLEINGIYQPVWALTMTYLTVVLSSMSAYSYPRLCELQALYDINEELNGIIRVAFLIIMPAMFLLLVARKPLILTLYSSDFLPATNYMPMQIFGDFFKLLFWALGMYLLPMKRLLGFIVLNILIDFLLVILAYFLIGIYNLHGVTVSFAVSHLIGFIALFLYSKKKIGFYFWPMNYSLIITSLCSLFLIAFIEKILSWELNLAANIFIFIFWATICIRKDEIIKLKYYFIIAISNKLTKNRAT